MLPEVVAALVAKRLHDLDAVALPFVQREALDFADVCAKRSVRAAALMADKHTDVNGAPRRLLRSAVRALGIALHLGRIYSERLGIYRRKYPSV